MANLFVVFRVIIEKLFREFIDYYKNSESFQEFVKSELKDIPSNSKELIKNLNSSDPKMTKINLVLDNRRIQSQYFTLQQYPTDMILPSFTSSSNILYGTLSEIVHNPDLQAIVYSSEETNEWKRAYKYLGERFQVKSVQYDIKAAIVGDEKSLL